MRPLVRHDPPQPDLRSPVGTVLEINSLTITRSYHQATRASHGWAGSEPHRRQLPLISTAQGFCTASSILLAHCFPPQLAPSTEITGWAALHRYRGAFQVKDLSGKWFLSSFPVLIQTRSSPDHAGALVLLVRSRRAAPLGTRSWVHHPPRATRRVEGKLSFPGRADKNQWWERNTSQQIDRTFSSAKACAAGQHTSPRHGPWSRWQRARTPPLSATRRCLAAPAPS